MNRKPDLTLFFSLLAFIAAFFGLMTYWSPIALDDYVFMSVYNEVNGGSDSFSLGSLYDFAMEIRKADNCRFSNIMDPVFTMMSPWKEIFPWLNGVLCALIVWIIIEIAGIKRYRFPTTALIWFAVVVCLPWRNAMFITDYALNYVFPAFLTLVFIYLICGADRHGWSAVRTVAVVLIAIPTGAWHEGFFAATVCGFGFCALLRKFDMPWQWWLAMVVYSTIAFIFALSPGIMTRAAREISVEPRVLPIWHIMYDLAPCLFLIFIYILLAITSTGRRFIKHILKNQAFIVVTIAAIAGIILSIIVVHRLRTVFWPNLCAIASFAILTSEFIRFFPNENRAKLRKILSAAAFAAVIFCVSHAILCLKWQYKFYVENETIMTQVEAGVNDIYHDRLHRYSPRIATLCFPTSYIWNTFHYRGLSERFGRHIAVVPTALRNVRTQQPDTLGGNIGAMRTGDAIWTEGTFLPEWPELPLHITFDDGTAQIIPYCVARHFATNDGDSLTAIDVGRINPMRVTAISMP